MRSFPLLYDFFFSLPRPAYFSLFLHLSTLTSLKHCPQRHLSNNKHFNISTVIFALSQKCKSKLYISWKKKKGEKICKKNACKMEKWERKRRKKDLNVSANHLLCPFFFFFFFFLTFQFIRFKWMIKQERATTIIHKSGWDMWC